MGGSRTKKGTRKGKQQIKKSSVMSCYKPEGTKWGQDFDESEYYKTSATRDKYMPFWSMFMSVGDALDKLVPPTYQGQIERQTTLLSCIHTKDYSVTRKSCNDDCSIELRESPVGGVGVFATKDIKQATAITMYPPNYLRVMLNPIEGSVMDATTAECMTQAQIDPIIDRLLDYKMGEDDKITMIGDPSFRDEWSFLGHMINDLSYDKTFEYKWDKANVCFGKTGHIVNIRDIKKGEELSLHYGVSYWFQGGVKYPESRHATHIG